MVNFGRVAVVLDQHFRDLMATVCAPVTVVTKRRTSMVRTARQ